MDEFERKHPRGKAGRFAGKQRPQAPARGGAEDRGNAADGDARLHMLTAVEPRSGYRIWVRFADGVHGEADLSDVAGQGVFAAWDDRAYFETVHVHPDRRAIVWGDDHDLDICPDRLYMEITGAVPEPSSLVPG